MVTCSNVVCFPLCKQLFQVSSANEWKTICVKSMFAESDEEVLVKCSTWTADSKSIICAARNAVLVRVSDRAHLFHRVSMRGNIIFCVCQMCDIEDLGANQSCFTRLSCADKNLHHRVHLVLPDLVVISLKETGKRGCLSEGPSLSKGTERVFRACVLVINVRSPSSPELSEISLSCPVISQSVSSTFSFVHILGNNPNTADMSEHVSLPLKK